MVNNMEEIFKGVFRIGHNAATINSAPGKRVYGEKLEKTPIGELRIWDAYRSKLSGAMKKGLVNFPFKKGSKVLYLGASTGTTISHLSDIVGPEGEIYAVEIAPQCMKALLNLCDVRENIIPIHADARQPKEYEDVGEVDTLYMDVAQPDQDDILIDNAKMFLKKDGIAMICIKSQSIDVTKRPGEVYDAVLSKLGKHFEVLERIKLDPYDKDHLFAVLKHTG
jgi:fibrillarin-like pre-rRNA processing protein